MKSSWRLIRDDALRGHHNMARDWALLESVTAGISAPALRLYRWNPPCLSLGRHQEPAGGDLAFCRDHNIDVIRRPTGGRTVLHQLELTYSVAAPLGVAPLPTGLQDTYRAVCAALVDASLRLGVDAELTPGNVNLSLPGPRSAIPCFNAPAGGEVVVAGRKLVGSAMRSHRGAIIQHGAILLDWDGKLQAGAMGLPDDRFLRPAVTTMAAELGRIPTDDDLDAALVGGFETALDLTFEPDALTAIELARADEIADTYLVQSAC